MTVAGTDDVDPAAGATRETRAELASHFDMVCRGFRRGRVTPVLGAGASLFGRSVPTSGEWVGSPSAGELAARLAKEFGLPEELRSTKDLLGIAQWIAAMRGGRGPLYEELHDVFDRDTPIPALHDFLAGVPGRLREAGLLAEPPLFVTTNYDDLLERAFEARDEPYDLVVYMADGDYRGHFCHQPPGGELQLIENPDDYQGANPAERTVIVKLHGFVNRRDRKHDSYVITEDHYIEYLALGDLDNFLPVHVLSRLLNCHLLFLGYSLRDWNLRAILYRLHARAMENDWWSVNFGTDAVERKSWEGRDVTTIELALEDYLTALNEAFGSWISERA